MRFYCLCIDFQRIFPVELETSLAFDAWYCSTLITISFAAAASVCISFSVIATRGDIIWINGEYSSLISSSV